MGFFKKAKNIGKRAYAIGLGASLGTAVGGPMGALAGGYAGYQYGQEKWGSQGGKTPGVQDAPDSPFGIPLPPKTGSQLGQDAADYYKTAFPGTNPWEQLGASNPAGAVETSNIAAKQQQRGIDAQIYMQSREMNNKRSIAQIGAKAQKFSSIISAGSNLMGGTGFRNIGKTGRLIESQTQKNRYPLEYMRTGINIAEDVGAPGYLKRKSEDYGIINSQKPGFLKKQGFGKPRKPPKIELKLGPRNMPG